ncbi:ribbon-helix-helix domain-containing protein [Mucisphaera calidilacus]|uniref:Antitoxin ParD4 n=1 Tax=Mucisphaera calidilacus TaxID=2527982 RepID=A0A518BZT7_9BACT|nr:addiction module antitoxin [Mucisphaera calidilacus]QDU72488.1 hypothetical protein Pan265_23540 [Mucisphaera calidilacus]
MGKEIQFEVPEGLHDFICAQSGAGGLYATTDEYLRDLIRRDYERQQAGRWQSLLHELEQGMEADDSDFQPLDMDAIKADAKKQASTDAA